MLLLPDHCWSNGKTNIVPFYERMEALGCVFQEVRALSGVTELFVGNIGAYTISEFEEIHIKTEEFPLFMEKRFNIAESSAAHFVFR